MRVCTLHNPAQELKSTSRTSSLEPILPVCFACNDRMASIMPGGLPPTARITRFQVEAGLGGVESWRFADRLRFEIEPEWQGEMPRTVLIGRDGKLTVMPGIADLAAVRGLVGCSHAPIAPTSSP